MKFNKCDGNPILSPNPKNDWESLCVLNPAVVFDEGRDEFVMLYRAAGNDEEHYIYLGLATSKDGVHFERKMDEPVFGPDKSGADGGGTEDPRICMIGDYYYMTYASRVFAPGQYWLPVHGNFGFYPKEAPKAIYENNTETHLAVSKDLVHWKKLGRITDSRDDDRDVVIFPEKINGKFYRFSRPMFKEGAVRPSIWISSSSDLLEWHDNLDLFYEGGSDWEDAKVGISCPPLKTKDGWLVIYHGVAKKDSAYRVGAFLLDVNDPRKVLARTKKYLMEPEFDYETKGYYNGCVFPTGNVIRDDTLYIYYGAADHYIGLATCSLSELLKGLKEGRL